MHFDRSIGFQDKMTAVETACEFQYEGANLFKYIKILVTLFCVLFMYFYKVFSLEVCWRLF